MLLFPFVYSGQTITGVSSYVFTNTSTTNSTTTGRGQNDKNNKMREAIIGAIINQRVPEVYYRVERWLSLKNTVDGFLYELHEQKPYSHVECIHAAGRGHNYDFSIVFTDETGGIQRFNVEFKFNATKVSDTPQFVSPMKPSQYLSASYEEYFYDNYMSTIASAASAAAPTALLPDRAEWLKQIHNNARVVRTAVSSRMTQMISRSMNCVRNRLPTVFGRLLPNTTFISRNYPTIFVNHNMTRRICYFNLARRSILPRQSHFSASTLTITRL